MARLQNNPTQTRPSYVTCLNDADVLLGRGSGPNTHAGNQKFRELIYLRREAYFGAITHQEQDEIFVDIIAHVYASGGRFLKQVGKAKKAAPVEPETNFPPIVYEIVTDTKVLLYKVTQAFRYLKAKEGDEELVEKSASAHAAAPSDTASSSAPSSPMKHLLNQHVTSPMDIASDNCLPHKQMASNNLSKPILHRDLRWDAAPSRTDTMAPVAARRKSSEAGDNILQPPKELVAQQSSLLDQLSWRQQMDANTNLLLPIRPTKRARQHEPIGDGASLGQNLQFFQAAPPTTGILPTIRRSSESLAAPSLQSILDGALLSGLLPSSQRVEVAASPGARDGNRALLSGILPSDHREQGAAASLGALAGHPSLLSGILPSRHRQEAVALPSVLEGSRTLLSDNIPSPRREGAAAALPSVLGGNRALLNDILPSPSQGEAAAVGLPNLSSITTRNLLSLAAATLPQEDNGSLAGTSAGSNSSRNQAALSSSTLESLQAILAKKLEQVAQKKNKR